MPHRHARDGSAWVRRRQRHVAGGSQQPDQRASLRRCRAGPVAWRQGGYQSASADCDEPGRSNCHPDVPPGRQGAGSQHAVRGGAWIARRRLACQACGACGTARIVGQSAAASAALAQSAYGPADCQRTRGRAGQTRHRRGVPAEGETARQRGGRLRGARPLASSAAWTGLARRIHPDRRAERPDRSADPAHPARRAGRVPALATPSSGVQRRGQHLTVGAGEPGAAGGDRSHSWYNTVWPQVR